LTDSKKIEEELAPTTVKQRQEKLHPNTSGLSDLTTSTIKGKTKVVAPEQAPAERPTPAALTPVAPPNQAVGSPPPEPSLNAVTKHRDRHGVGPARRPKVSRPSAAPKRGSTETEQPGQLTTAIPDARDAGAAGQ